MWDRRVVTTAATYLENIKANGSGPDVDVRVEAWGIKPNCWRDIGIIGWEGYCDFEGESGVDLRRRSCEWHLKHRRGGTDGLRGALNCPDPFKQVPVAFGKCGLGRVVSTRFVSSGR